MWPQMVANIPTLKNKNPEQNKKANKCKICANMFNRERAFWSITNGPKYENQCSISMIFKETQLEEPQHIFT